jgi:hypothetical protein
VINLPSSIAKGEILSFALNKPLVIAAVSDSYWSDAYNIQKCVVVYKSSSGHQRKRLEFDFTQENPIVTAQWSLKARNSFEIEEIVLIDFDNGSYTIPRSSLPSGKGISFAGEGGGGSVVAEVVHNYQLNGNATTSIANGNDLYIGGSFSSVRYSANGVVKIDSNTAENVELDQFAAGFPKINGNISKAVYDGPDVMYIIGSFTQVENLTRRHCARLLRNGNDWVLDTNVSINFQLGFPPTDILVHTNYLFFTCPGSFASFVAFNKTSFAVVASGYGGASASTFYKLAVDDRYVYYCGFLSVSGNQGRIYRRDLQSPSLALDTSFTYTTTNTSITDISVVGNDVYIAGSFTNYSTGYYLAKFNKNTGAIDTNFASPVNSSHLSGRLIWSIVVDGDHIYAGGTIPQLGKNLIKINRFTGALLSEFDAGTICSVGSGTAVVNTVVKNGPYIYPMGTFEGRNSTANSIRVINLAKVDAVSGALITEFNTKDQQLAVSEKISFIDFGTTGTRVFGDFQGWGGFSRAGVAKFTKDSYGNWKIVESFDPGVGGTSVNTMALDGDHLYLGGNFNTWAGASRLKVARISSINGSLDPFFGVGVFTSGVTSGQFNGFLNQAVNKIIVDGDNVFFGTSSTLYSKKSSTGSAVSTSFPYWMSVNKLTNTESIPTFGPNGIVYEMLIDGNNIYFGGTFTSWAGTTRSYLAKANKTNGALDTQWVPPTGYTATGSGDYVTKMKMIGSNILVGSHTQAVGGVSGNGGVFFVNKDTGALVQTYLATSFGGSSSRVTTGSILEDAEYVYLCTGRNVTNLSISFRRIRKSDLALDTSWGFFNIGALILAAEIYQNEIILCTSANSTFNLMPHSKRIFSMNTSDGSQRANI